MKGVFFLILPLSLFFPHSALMGQSPSMREDSLALESIEANSWKEALDELEYDSSLLDKVLPGEEKPDRGMETPSSRLSEGWRTFFRVLLLIGGLVFLSWLLVSVFGKRQGPLIRSKKTADLKKPEAEVHQVREDDLTPLNPEDHAGLVARGEFREVIRLSYLQLIRSLSEKGMIHWKKEKTNRDYVAELQRSGLQTEFSRLTDIFEHYWYGSFPLSEATFQRVFPEFQEMARKVESFRGKAE